MCDARLNGGPLTCTRSDDHESGHVYVSAWAADKHTTSEAVEE